MKLQPAHPFLAAVASLVILAWPASGDEPDPQPVTAAALRQKHVALRERLDTSAFGRPLVLDSSDAGGSLKGDVHAVIEQPFRKVQTLASAKDWCDLLVLPFNVQKCEATGDQLSIFIGRRPDSPPIDAKRLDLKFSLLARTDDLLQVRLMAPTGPAGTRDYRIIFEATPLDERRTLVHMGYGYGYGAMSSLVMQSYLATSGKDKVGFTSQGVDEQGRPRLVGGMRGVMERNTMRYFLAIEAFLDAIDTPPDKRRAARAERWYAAVDKHPRQLREMTRVEYLALKAP
ncbi:MAG: hypothetical protein ABIR98_14435 [Usitatibacter sp.]